MPPPITTTPMSIIIAIDGDSASGKGTLARKLAEKMDFAYLDTGLLYRQTAFIVLKNNKNIGLEEDCAWAARQVRIEDLQYESLRSEDVSQAASKVAIYPAVRQILLPLQRDFAQNPPGGKRGAVLDGRDIGTVVCPKAQVKLYVTADPAIRAERRLKELQNQGIEAIQTQVFEDLKQRDSRDSSRKTAPLKMASDAHHLDTTSMTADDVLAKALDYVQQKSKDCQ